MTTSDWTSALADFLDVVLADLAALVRECSDDVWELSMWDVTKDPGGGRPRPPIPRAGPPTRGAWRRPRPSGSPRFPWSTRWMGISGRARPRGSRPRRSARAT